MNFIDLDLFLDLFQCHSSIKQLKFKLVKLSRFSVNQVKFYCYKHIKDHDML